MAKTRLTAWRPLGAFLLACAGALALSGCGGGSGAPNNPFAPQPAIPIPLSVTAGSSTAFAGTPLILTIRGGTPPYTASSSNPAALPVPANVNGDTLILLANNVANPTPTIVTIRDAAGTQVLTTITVGPAVLLPASLTITENSAPCDVGDVCSGQTAVASVRVTGPGGTPIVGRSVRFDVVQGVFSLQTTTGGALAATQTVTSDANGEARVIISVPLNTPTQIGLLRATELTTSSQVTAQFVIAQVTSGEGVLSVVPGGNTTITGPVQGVCSAGVRVSYFVIGGTPPYRVVVNFPDTVTIVGNPITANGGGFDLITNGSCFVNLTFAVTDANGRTITGPTVTNEPGTFVPPVVPTPPQSLQVSAPGAGDPTNRLNCGPGTTVAIVATGVAPFSAAASQAGVTVAPDPISPPSASPGRFLVSGLSNAGTPTDAAVNTFTVTISDSNTPQQLATVQIFCN